MPALIEFEEYCDAELVAKVPERIRNGLFAYANHHFPVGGFLTAMLENDLNAIMLADDDCFEAIRDIRRFIYNYLPSNCWGSKEQVKLWKDAPESDARKCGDSRCICTTWSARYDQVEAESEVAA